MSPSISPNLLWLHHVGVFHIYYYLGDDISRETFHACRTFCMHFPDWKAWAGHRWASLAGMRMAAVYGGAA